MAEEEAVVEPPTITYVVTATSPVATKHKWKLQDLETREAIDTVEAEEEEEVVKLVENLGLEFGESRDPCSFM